MPTLRTEPTIERFVPEQRNARFFNSQSNYRRRTTLYEEHTTWFFQPDEIDQSKKYG